MESWLKLCKSRDVSCSLAPDLLNVYLSPLSSTQLNCYSNDQIHGQSTIE